MPLLTYTDVKSMLGIIHTKFDAQIQMILPGALDKAFNSTNNYFHIPDQYVRSEFISFNSANKKIISSNYDFSVPEVMTVTLQQGLFIHVSDSLLNDGYYKIDSYANDEITLDSEESLKDESEGANVRIDVIKVPESFLLAVSRFIGEIFGKEQGIKSERIGNYSVTYSDENEALDNLFMDFRKVGW